MPRKSNKTAHVLNLLASGAPKEDLPEENTADNIKSAPSAKITISNPTSPADPLANLIKDSLDREVNGPVSETLPDLSDEPAAKEPPAETLVQETPAGNAPAGDSAAPAAMAEDSSLTGTSREETKDTQTLSDNVIAEKTLAEDESAKEFAAEDFPAEEASAETVPSADSSVKNPALKEEQPEKTMVVQIDAEPENALTAQSLPETAEIPVTPPKPEVTYSSLNVMDRLVDNRLLDYMGKFDTCTCDRCQADAKALALSNLPPKYVVVPNTSIAPLMSFYTSKYNVNLITELTKACMAIINSPRHED